MTEEQWIIQTTWEKSGDVAFWGRAALTAVRVEAVRFESAEHAYAKAEQLKAEGRVNDYQVIEVSRPPHTGTEGNSGRA